MSYLITPRDFGRSQLYDLQYADPFQPCVDPAAGHIAGHCLALSAGQQGPASHHRRGRKGERR